MSADQPASAFDDLVAARRQHLEREATPAEQAARRAARALHDLAERLVVEDPPAQALDALADVLESLRADLPDTAASSRYEKLAAGASVIHALETHAVGGPANPIAAPLLTTMAHDGEVRGETRFGPLHEGTPDVVHGGFVAAVFDQLLGAAAATAGRAMVTGTMTIRYLRPTPINVDLEFSTRLRSTEGRRLLVAGTCSAGGEVTAEAEAVFISVDPQRYLRR